MKKQYYTEAELKKLFTNLRRKGFTDVLANVLISHTYNRPVNMRTSGFYFPGNPDATLAWDNSTRTVSLTPLEPNEPVYDAKGNLYVPNFRFYVWEQEAIQQRKEQEETLQIPAEEGLFLVHFAVNQETRRYELRYIKNPLIEDIASIYLQGVPVCWIYWDATAGEAIYFGDSRHGSQWNPQIHWVWHQTLNSLRESGLKITGAVFDGAGDANEDFQFGISAGKLWHEDIFWETDAVTALQSLPVWYFDSAGAPRFVTADSGKKFLNTGTGRVAYNPAGGNLEEITNGQFALYHLFATNCTIHPVISVMGTDDFPGIGEAVSAVESEVATLRQNLPHSNLMHIGSFILQTDDAYTNSAKARVVWASSDIDTFTTELLFDDVTRELTLKQNNDKPDLKVTIPGGEGEGTPGADGESAYVYIAYASDASGTGFTTTFNAALDYIAVLSTNTEIVSPQASDFTGLWKKYKGESGADGADGTSVLILGSVTTSTNLPGYPDTYTGDIGDGYITSDTGHLWVWSGTGWVDAGNITGPAGADGADGADGDSAYEIAVANGFSGTEQEWLDSLVGADGADGAAGADGADGDSAYVYIAYASDASGTGFTTTFNAALDYIAVLSTNTEITTPQTSDFTGLWKKYKGEPGADGADGADGTSVLILGSVTTSTNLPGYPDTYTGDIGDGYITSDTGHLWVWSGTAWVDAGNITGPAGADGADGDSAYEIAVANGFVGTEQEWLDSLVGADGADGAPGADGADGAEWHTGSTTPGSATGKVGDFYLRTTNGYIYEKTGASTWTYRANITGPAGADGTDGINGTDGDMWHAGADYPSSALGKVGDFYLRTTNGYVYEKTTTSTWSYRANITGPAGADGADGSDADCKWVVDANGIHYSAGNVGIGTDSDSANALNVAKNVSGTYVASFNNSNGTNGAGIIINVSNNNSSYYALNILSNTGALFNIANNGNVRFSKYGSGSFTGTATKWLAVDSSGNLIEVNAPSVSSPWTDAGAYLYPTDGERVQIGYSGANNYAKLYVDGDIATGVGKFLGFNAYYNSGWKHVGSGHATFVKQESTDFTFYVSDTIRSAGQTVTFNSIKFQNSTGNVIANDFVHTSMRKLKKWIKDIIKPERFDKIKIQQFVFRKDKSKRVRYGVIAEDVEKIAPELVITDEKGEKTVSYIDLALAKIARLEQRIKELEESNNGN